MSPSQREEIRIRLDEIAERNGGRITPDEVIADARDESSPLHACFEWSVDKAAMEHWREQARCLIRSVRVLTHTESRSISTIGYVRDPSIAASDQGYIAVSALRTDEDMARAAVVEEFARAAAALRRAREVAEVLGMRADVEKLQESVEKATEKAKGGRAQQPSA